VRISFHPGAPDGTNEANEALHTSAGFALPTVVSANLYHMHIVSPTPTDSVRCAGVRRVLRSTPVRLPRSLVVLGEDVEEGAWRYDHSIDGEVPVVSCYEVISSSGNCHLVEWEVV